MLRLELRREQYGTVPLRRPAPPAKPAENDVGLHNLTNSSHKELSNFLEPTKRQFNDFPMGRFQISANAKKQTHHWASNSILQDEERTKHFVSEDRSLSRKFVTEGYLSPIRTMIIFWRGVKMTRLPSHIYSNATSIFCAWMPGHSRRSVNHSTYDISFSPFSRAII